jgi:hypothetical protein
MHFGLTRLILYVVAFILPPFFKQLFDIFSSQNATNVVPYDQFFSMDHLVRKQKLFD